MSNKKQNGLIIIPARKNSKRIKSKNLKELNGKPLIEYTLIHAVKSKIVKEVIVSTDCQKIKNFCLDFGVQVIQRPSNISGDKSSSEEAIIHALDYRKKDGLDDPGYVVFLQCTSPIRKLNDIDNAIQKFKKDSCDSLLSVCENKNFLWNIKNGRCSPINYDFTNRKMEQDFKGQFRENGSIYITKTSLLRKKKCRLGSKIGFYEMDYMSSFQIDEIQDFELISKIIKTKERKIFDKIELVIFDFDGVMTNNKFLLNKKGAESVELSREDGLSISLLKKILIKIIILSSEKNNIVTKRCKKLKVECIQGISNKKKILESYINKFGINPKNILYVGNDLNDLECMKIVGWPIAVNDADPKIKDVSKIILKKKGGQGIVKEIYNLLT